MASTMTSMANAPAAIRAAISPPDTPVPFPPATRVWACSVDVQTLPSVIRVHTSAGEVRAPGAAHLCQCGSARLPTLTLTCETGHAAVAGPVRGGGPDAAADGTASTALDGTTIDGPGSAPPAWEVAQF